MAQFSTTHWTVILLAGQQDSEKAHQALEKVCERYWYPLYSYVRRLGYEAPDACDSTQGFFLHLIEKSLVAKADPDAGRFRSFLLTSLKNYLLSEQKRGRAFKRGGGEALLSLDEELAEARFAREPQEDRSPDRMFERNWALNLIEQTLSLLKQEFERANRGPLYSLLESALVKEPEALSYQEIAAQLGMTESAVKVSAFRMRGRFCEILRGLLASTVADPMEVDAELSHLFAVLG